MKGWVTFTHHVSGEKLHIQTKNVVGIRECERANLLLLKEARSMYISESTEQVFALIELAEGEVNELGKDGSQNTGD